MMNKAFLSGVDDFISKPYNIIEFFARIMANVKKGKLIRKLKEESELDYLTKIYNRRTLFRFIVHLFSSAVRYDEDISFLMMDIDHFKNINDKYGHFAGDEVLKRLAKMIESSLRKADVIGRFGGEEFCAVMPHTSMSEACMAAEKIRRSIESSVTEFGSDKIQITLSIGIAQLSDDKQADSLLRKADEALYNAKNTGRNKICFYDKNNTVSTFKA